MILTITTSAEDFTLYTTIATVLTGFYLVGRAIYNARMAIKEQSIGTVNKESPAGFNTFLIMLTVASALVIAIKYGIESGNTTLSQLLFVVFPYLAIGLLLVGSIYRYVNRGYQVSSLSTQFLEGQKLFWGSQAFHWGIILLFFGHLIAFLFPKTLLLWNGATVRLLILELTSFAFGICALFGIVILIKRRLQSKMLMVVSNKMDMLVYVILIVQICSGLGVAFFERWGSSWFASAVTPYLKSLFTFSPDPSTVVTLPWSIQLHITSAFFIIAILPFTRFVHFLVAPIDYIWRRYQVVIWNWNQRAIRNSKSHFPGHRPKNH